MLLRKDKLVIWSEGNEPDIMKNNNKFINGIFNKNATLINERLSIDSYVSWLLRFCDLYPAWRDDLWVKDSIKLSKEDIKNVSLLYLFYDLIDNYARINNIQHNKFANETYYLIKINNIGYAVGFIDGHESCYFCQKENLIGKEFIDFSNINGNLEYKAEVKSLKGLDDLENLLLELYNNNITISEIEDTTNKFIKRIRSKNK